MNCPNHPKQEAPCNDVNCDACHGRDPIWKRRALKDLAQEALEVQDACNLSSVVHSFARAMHDLCELVPQGTDARHAITVLWADKVAHLAGIQHPGDERVMSAYAEVKKLAK